MSNYKSGKIALIAHCILNQNSRAAGLAEKSSILNEIVEFLAYNGIGIIQLPCPEVAYAGISRQPKPREQYNNAEFRRLCKKIAKDFAIQATQYEANGIKLKLVLGVDGSPSCSVDNAGIFMEILRSALNKNGILPPFYNIHHKTLAKDLLKLKKLVK